MDELEIETPYTISEFYETYNIIHQSEKFKSVMYRYEKQPFSGLLGVFWSSGIPIESPDRVIHSIMYDQETNSVTDYAGREGMYEALEYIKALSDNSFINISKTSRELVVNFYIERVQ